MEIFCNIIRDLLPLYAEDLVSEDSKKLVDEHLCQCDPCTKQLGILKKAAQIPIEVETKSLKRVGDTIRRRRILAVLTVFLFLITICVSWTMFMDASVYLTAEQAIAGVVRLSDGGVRYYLTNMVKSHGAFQSDNPRGNTGIICWTRMESILFPSDWEQKSTVIELENGEKTYTGSYGGIGHPNGSWAMEDYYYGALDNLWYVDAKTGMPQTLLWEGEGGYAHPEGTLMDVNYDLAYYCIAFAGAAAVLAAVGYLLRKRWYGELCTRFAIVTGCICLSVVIVSGGQFMDIWGDFAEYSKDGLILAVPMTLTALFARQLHKLNKQDKGL